MNAHRLLLSAPYALAGAVVVISLWGETPVAGPRESGGCIGRQQAVGGVSISPDGALKNADEGAIRELQAVRAQLLKRVPANLERHAELRKVSLRRLEAAIAEQQTKGKDLEDSVRLLAGLQSIRYVFVVPEERDIILAGPAEGWTVDARGTIVGRTTGKPVLWLDDLLVALRAARQMKQAVITCSIDPSADGLKRLREHVAQLTTIGNPAETAQTIEQILGAQLITVGGVPDTSHFARVLVAADYRMKRLGMGFDPAPVAGMPSYLQMMKLGGRGMQNMTPRWWMVPEYGLVRRDPSGSMWELPDAAVKTLTEETFFGKDGTAESRTGKTSTAAQRWADIMTTKYEELAGKEPIFAQLRNCMQLALASTLIVHGQLPAKAGHDFQLLFSKDQLPAEELLAPRRIDTQVSFIKRGSSWVLSASGGVQIEPARAMQQAQTSTTLAADAGRLKLPAGTTNSSWWWD
jgi:Protein of unknown function (DUF1598)